MRSKTFYRDPEPSNGSSFLMLGGKQRKQHSPTGRLITSSFFFGGGSDLSKKNGEQKHVHSPPRKTGGGRVESLSRWDRGLLCGDQRPRQLVREPGDHRRVGWGGGGGWGAMTSIQILSQVPLGIGVLFRRKIDGLPC